MLKQRGYLKGAGSRNLGGLRLAVLWLALASAASGAAPGQPTFTASLDRDSVVVGETVALTLKFEGGSPQGMPPMPAIPGLQPAGGISSSVNSTVVNGAMTTVVSYVLNLVAQQAGDFVIPPLTADVEGRKLQSQPLKLRVLQSDPTAPPLEDADKLAFLWLALPKKDMFVGEVFVAELRLYIRGEVQNITDVQLPPLRGDGFTSSKVVEGQRFQRRVGAAQFTVIPLLTALTAVKSGQLALGPMNASLVAHLPVTGRRQFNPFELFGPQTQPRQVALAMDQQTVNVLPLPADNVPTGFNGAVGAYTMTFSAGPASVAVGDPITVKIQISGRGYLDALAMPEQPSWHDFKIYPATSHTETQDQLGFQGTKFFEQIVIPQSAEIKELPPVSFSFFDPDKKAYQTLTQPAVKLAVRPGGQAAAPTVAGPRPGAESPPPTPDIVQIKPRLGVLAGISPPLLKQPWFRALQGVPVLAWLAAWTWRRRIESLANNPRLRRQRHVAQVIRAGLAGLPRLAAENQSDEFFAALFRLLQEQLGERLDLPASAITEAVIEDYLFPRGMPPATLASLRDLFQHCNLARYAPTRTSQELAALIPKTETVLRELQALKL